MNENSKPWYLSKGFVGPLVTAILFSLRGLGIADVDPATILGILYHGAEFVGVVVGMTGRALAQSRLTLGLERGASSGPDGGASTSGRPRDRQESAK